MRIISKKIFIILVSLFLINVHAFSETPEPYQDNEFPQVLKDIRRAEIITLGAMPFISISVSLGFSIGKYATNNFDPNYFVNPMAKNSSSITYSTEEQVGIIITSLCISSAIGISDFIYHAVKRNQKTKALTQKSGTIIINPVEQDPDAVKLSVPNANAYENENQEITEEKQLQENN